MVCTVPSTNDPAAHDADPNCDTDSDHNPHYPHPVPNLMTMM